LTIKIVTDPHEDSFVHRFDMACATDKRRLNVCPCVRSYWGLASYYVLFLWRWNDVCCHFL